MSLDEEISLTYDENRVDNFAYECGWVLPDGKFYGVEYANHDIICQFHFDIDVKEAEELGWARLTKEMPFFQCLKKYTKPQINTICAYYTNKEAFYALKKFFEVIIEEII